MDYADSLTLTNSKFSSLNSRTTQYETLLLQDYFNQLKQAKALDNEPIGGQRTSLHFARENSRFSFGFYL